MQPQFPEETTMLRAVVTQSTKLRKLWLSQIDIANNTIASLQIRDVCSRLSRLVKKGQVQGSLMDLWLLETYNAGVGGPCFNVLCASCQFEARFGSATTIFDCFFKPTPQCLVSKGRDACKHFASHDPNFDVP